MADIREIDMAKATNADGKKIRLVGDDGKGYWMEFSDLAAVVGERLLSNQSVFLDELSKKRDFKGTLVTKSIEPNNIDTLNINKFNYGLLIMIVDASYNICLIPRNTSNVYDILNYGFSHIQGTDGKINVWRDTSGGSIYIENKTDNGIEIDIRAISLDYIER